MSEIEEKCPVETVVGLIGSKWKILIIRNLLQRSWRFNELQRSLGSSQKSLTDALRALEADGLVERVAYPEIPPKVEYKLSELGLSLRPILRAMQSWGNQYNGTDFNYIPEE